MTSKTNKRVSPGTGYTKALSRRNPNLHPAAAPTAADAQLRATEAAQNPVDFVTENGGLTSRDLTYGAATQYSPAYQSSGTFSGPLPPWFNNVSYVPTTPSDPEHNWGWSQVWFDENVIRVAQVTAEQAYIQANVPGQTYSGQSTAEIIQQWYTQGMWDTNPVPNGNGDPYPPPFTQEQVDALTQTWIDDDLEFARQRLGGANPNVIRLATATEYHVGEWIGRATNAASLTALQKTLLQAQENNALLVCDYTPILGNVVVDRLLVVERNLAAPICYFTIDTQTNTVSPAAIQIVGTSSSSYYIFTPNDPKDPNGDAWLLAKLWVASADQQWWFSGSHLFNAHTITMTFGTAMLNLIQSGTMSADHPLVRLAKPYLSQVWDIDNVVISAPASNEGGIYQTDDMSSQAPTNFCDLVLPTGRVGIYQIISNLWANYDFDANAFDQQLASRGLTGGPIDSVTFPYRDDGQVWWSAIQSFVAGIVAATYPNGNADVAADAQLNAWMSSVQNAFNGDGTTRFTYAPTVDDLNKMLTNLLFNASVQHTTVNDTMLPGWAFTPNGAFLMMAAPPTDAESVSQATVLGSLPNPQNGDQLAGIIESQIVFVMNGTAGVTPPDTLAFESNDETGMLAVYDYAAGSPQEAAVQAFWNAIWTGPDSVNARITSNQSARVASWEGSAPVPNSLAYYYLSAALTPWTAPAYLNAPVMNQIQI